MAVITYREALNRALREEMERDDSVFLLGEEVGEYDGAYKVSKGLLDEFGEWRQVCGIARAHIASDIILIESRVTRKEIAYRWIIGECFEGCDGEFQCTSGGFRGVATRPQSSQHNTFLVFSDRSIDVREASTTEELEYDLLHSALFSSSKTKADVLLNDICSVVANVGNTDCSRASAG